MLILVGYNDGSKVSSINVDPNLTIAVLVFIFTLIIVGMLVRSTTSRRDRKIINHQPIWHDFEKEEPSEDVKTEDTES